MPGHDATALHDQIIGDEVGKVYLRLVGWCLMAFNPDKTYE